MAVFGVKIQKRNLSGILILTGCLLVPFQGSGQQPTFGDLIPDHLLPSSIHPDTRLDCNRYFHLADSINQRVYSLTGKNPIPESPCGNDTISFSTPDLETALIRIPPGSILARMILDRNGWPVCCKVYSKGTTHPGREVESALGKLRITPAYRNGEAVPCECRFVYDFRMPQLHNRPIIE